MKAGKYMLKFAALMMGALIVMSCLLPGMIPLTPIPTPPAPTMEKNVDTVLEVLRGQDFHHLSSLAKEQYTEEDYAKPGTLIYTVTIEDNKPIYFNYGWCTTTEEILKQNFEHIAVRLYLNEERLGNDVVHNLSYSTADNLLCLDFGVLLSDWPPGEYKLEAIATFDQKINDGLADYDAGDYIFQYNVTVEKRPDSNQTPSP